MSVYFITCREANAVKIGSSADPKGRLRGLQSACPLTLTIEAIVPGGSEEEFTLHRLFADDRLHHEWFKISPAIEEWIAANPAPEHTDRRKEKLRDKARLTPLWFLTKWEPEAAAEIISDRIAAGDLHFPYRERPLDLDLPARRGMAA